MRKIQDIPQIVISCQARSGQPFSGDVAILKKMVDSVVLGGVKGVRLDGEDCISYTKQTYPDVFVIGMKKIHNESSSLLGWVTPDIESAQEVIEASADMVVIDGSIALHTTQVLSKLIQEIKKEKEILIGCDVGTEEEALRAKECGADVVFTTFVQADTREKKVWSEHINILKKLAEKNIPVICEGGIVTEEQVIEVLSLGALGVVIGKVVVDPVFNTKRFVSTLEKVKQIKIQTLFESTFFEKPHTTVLLTPHGSSRDYYKIESAHHCAIATIGSDLLENKAFVEFSHHLKKQGVLVPIIYNFSKDYSLYIQEYCGDKDLFSLIQNSPSESYFSLLQKAVDLLDDFQKMGTENWDFSKCYPFPRFDKSEIIRDYERLKKRFFDNLIVSYENENLDAERDILIHLMGKIQEREFLLMHRDFQSRNILIEESGCYVLIDFQGARKGPIHYDLASLLWQSQMNYSKVLREEVIDYYLSKNVQIERSTFLQNFYIISVIRLIQSIGSYGIAGLEQKKEYFIKSIPFALQNIEEVFGILEEKYDVTFPYLRSVFLEAKEKLGK